MNNLLKYSFSFHQHDDSQKIKISFYLTLSFSSPPRVKSALATKGSYHTSSSCRGDLGVLLTAGRWGFIASSCRYSGMGFLSHAGGGALGAVVAAAAPGSGVQGMHGGSITQIPPMQQHRPTEALTVRTLGNKTNACLFQPEGWKISGLHVVVVKRQWWLRISGVPLFVTERA